MTDNEAAKFASMDVSGICGALLRKHKREHANICRTPGCGRIIPYDPEREKQHKHCQKCRSNFGGNQQRHNQKAAAKKRLKKEGETNEAGGQNSDDAAKDAGNPR